MVTISHLIINDGVERIVGLTINGGCYRHWDCDTRHMYPVEERKADFLDYL